MNRCHEIEPLLSQALDGELSEDRQCDVDHHLKACGHCAATYQSLAQVDQLIATPELPLSRDLFQHVQYVTRRRHRQRRRVWLAACSVAACLVLALMSIPWDHSPTTAAVPPITEPLERLQLINRVQINANHSTLRTCQWDLRALKLELEALQLDPDQKRKIMARIDRLLNRVRQQQDAEFLTKEGA